MTKIMAQYDFYFQSLISYLVDVLGYSEDELKDKSETELLELIDDIDNFDNYNL